MNNTIKAMATAMIIVLIVALIWIYIAYYKNNTVVDTITYSSGNSNVSSLEIPNGDYTNNEDLDSKLNETQGLIESIIGGSQLPKKENLEDMQKEIDSNSGDTDINSSGDKVTHTISGEDVKNHRIPEKTEVDIVIVSDPQTSNQEKQEVLTEIDKALQCLLEAVSKVEVVDETRLNASLDSEVDKP